MKCRCLNALIAIVAACAVTMAAPAAQALDLEAGGVVGGNWNYLERPIDPAGSYTFLWGSAFSGFGTLVGATGWLSLVEMEDAGVALTADLLYGYHRGGGWADHEDGGRIDVLFTAHVLRLPLLVRAGTPGGESGLTVGLGIEPVIGLMSTATVQTTDVGEAIQPVYTQPRSTMSGVFAIGYDWVSDDFTVPFDARLAWNPFMPSATEERFQSFDSPDEPGEFGVGFDWQIMVTAGVRFGVTVGE